MGENNIFKGETMCKEGENNHLNDVVDMDDPVNQFTLGATYYNGIFDEPDYKEAVKWFRLSAEQGYFLAQFFLGLCYLYGQGVRKNKHMGVDMLTKKLPSQVQDIIWIFNYILIFVFLAVVTFYGADLCVRNAARKYQTLYISYSYATVSCPIGCFLMAITSLKRVVEHTWHLLRSRIKKADTLVSSIV